MASAKSTLGLLRWHLIKGPNNKSSTTYLPVMKFDFDLVSKDATGQFRLI